MDSWRGLQPEAVAPGRHVARFQVRVDALTKLLSLPEKVLPISCIAVGWPGEEKAPRTRYQQSLVHHETW